MKQFLIQRLLTDSTMITLVGRNVYASQRDFIPDVYPAVTVSVIAGGHRTVPSRARDMLVQADIWSTTSMLECDNVYEQMTAILNTPVDSTAKLALDASTGNQIYWIREDSVVDVPDETRNLWHKAVSYRIWART